MSRQKFNEPGVEDTGAPAIGDMRKIVARAFFARPVVLVEINHALRPDFRVITRQARRNPARRLKYPATDGAKLRPFVAVGVAYPPQGLHAEVEAFAQQLVAS